MSAIPAEHPSGWTELLDDLSRSLLNFSNAPINPPAPSILAFTDPSGFYGKTVIFGNSNSLGFGGTGTPPGIFGALGINQVYDNGGAAIPKTTQGLFVNTSYKGPTSDDSAQSANHGVYLKDIGTPYTQTLAVTGDEAGVQIENNVTVSGQVLGHGKRLRVLAGGLLTGDVRGSKAYLQTRQNAGVSFGISSTNWKAYYDELFNPSASTPGLNASFHGRNMFLSEQSFVLSRSGYGGSFQIASHGSGGTNPGFMYISKPEPGNTNSPNDVSMTNGSREITTATVVTDAWISRSVTHANIPVGTTVLTYWFDGVATYHIYLTAAATNTLAAQTVAFTEIDLVGVKVANSSGGLQALFEGWAFGASNPNSRISRLGAFSSASNMAVYNATLATAQVGIDATGYHAFAAACEASGAAAAVLGSSAPAAITDLTKPYKWFRATTSDGSIVWFPGWK